MFLMEMNDIQIFVLYAILLVHNEGCLSWRETQINVQCYLYWQIYEMGTVCKLNKPKNKTIWQGQSKKLGLM